ncbi:hypothetical protein HJFPF1_12388 [Paramyrothecium foliicola]|nr:hypothetical protein HJFPF1_12388 [Paramyrothecium foliicola]
MGKRSRACEECHRLKIKCQSSPSLQGACERCLRNSLPCVPAAPRLQRDRIIELESEIHDLRSALRDHSIGSSTPSRSSCSLLEDQGHAMLSFLDVRIPPSKQQDLLHVFAQQAGAAWPVIRLPLDLEQLRAKCPILLLCVLVYGVSNEAQDTTLEVHDELVRETMHIIGEELIARGQRSLELVQALLVASYWSKTTRRGRQLSPYQLVQLATDMAIDLGIAGPSLNPSPPAYFCRLKEPESLESRRTWLACYIALSTVSTSTRRPTTVPWNAYHEECLLYLESRGDPSDLLLCQIVRITQLIQEIANRLCLCQLTTFIDCNEYSVYAVMEALKNKVDAWAAQIPSSLAMSQTLQVWRHVAMIYIHEIVLHTPSNKASFAAPFIPGRIPVKDFPRPPNVIPSLEWAFRAIIEHCHGVIDTMAEMDPALVLSLPTFSFTPNVLYSLFVLVTAMVAATDPTNTYGQFVAKESFGIEHCTPKLRRLTVNVRSLDPLFSCFATRLIDATGWLEEWYTNYTSILRRYETSLASLEEIRSSAT